MKIRKARENDVPDFVIIDRRAYGNYGSDQKYFREKFNSKNTWILTVEEDKKITGFAVIEKLRKGEIPSDFTELSLTNPFKNSWLHIIAFTTKTNYQDIKSDSKLVKAVEKLAKKLKLKNICVPLSKDHPFTKHNVFEFWEINGYKKAGTIKWIVNPTEKIECYFYKKEFL